MTLKVFITAGEASGDVLGAHLMAALRELHGGDIEFAGVGGAAMAAAGLESIFPMQDLSVMGLAEVLPRIPKIMRRIAQTAQAATAMKPDYFITIDSPDFSFRVARAVRAQAAAHGMKMVHYVAPTVWAWRPERAKKVAALYDGILCLLPFEPPYFEAEGMKAAFVGHAVMESGLAQADGAVFRARHGIPDNAPVLGVLFGSRMGELNRMGPVLRAAALRLAKNDARLHIVSPTLPHLYRDARNFLHKMPAKIHMTTDPVEKNEAFRAMDCALATSGTVGLELAVADVPHIIAYRVNALTAYIVRRKIRTKYAHLANILLQDEAVPEFLQEKCVAEDMAAMLRSLKDGAAAQQQRTAFAKVRDMIGGAEKTAPSLQAARFILGL